MEALAAAAAAVTVVPQTAGRPRTAPAFAAAAGVVVAAAATTAARPQVVTQGSSRPAPRVARRHPATARPLCRMAPRIWVRVCGLPGCVLCVHVLARGCGQVCVCSWVQFYVCVPMRSVLCVPVCACARGAFLLCSISSACLGGNSYHPLPGHHLVSASLYPCLHQTGQQDQSYGICAYNRCPSFAHSADGAKEAASAPSAVEGGSEDAGASSVLPAAVGGAPATAEAAGANPGAVGPPGQGTAQHVFSVVEEWRALAAVLKGMGHTEKVGGEEGGGS